MAGRLALDGDKYRTILAKTPFWIVGPSNPTAYWCTSMTKSIGAASSQERVTYRRSRIVVVPPVDELDLVKPLQVFSSVNRLTGQAIYSIEIVTNAKPLRVQGEGGILTFLAEGHFREVKGKFDSVLLVCGLASRTTRDAALFAWLRSAAKNVRRLGAVCVGTFLLAEAGLLNGKKATAHWKFGRELAKRYPRVKVESDPLWVRDGNIYTSAGISAGIDLALAWVEEDCSSAIAHEAAPDMDFGAHSGEALRATSRRAFVDEHSKF